MSSGKLDNGLYEALTGNGDWVQPLKDFVSTSKGLRPVRCTVKMFNKIQGMFKELHEDTVDPQYEVGVCPFDLRFHHPPNDVRHPHATLVSFSYDILPLHCSLDSKSMNKP